MICIFMIHQLRLFKRGSIRTCSKMITRNIFGRFMLQNNALAYFWRRCANQSLDSSIQSVLVKLHILYGLWCLDKHLALFYQGKGFVFIIHQSKPIIPDCDVKGFLKNWLLSRVVNIYKLYKKEVNANISSELPTSHVKMKIMLLLNRNQMQSPMFILCKQQWRVWYYLYGNEQAFSRQGS